MMGTREKVGYKILVSKQNQQVLFLSNTRALCTGVWMSTTLSIKPTFSRFYVFVSFVKLPKTMPILQRKQYSSINSTALLKVKENQSVTKKNAEQCISVLVAIPQKQAWINCGHESTTW